MVLLRTYPYNGTIGDFNLVLTNALRRRLVVRVNAAFQDVDGAILVPRDPSEPESTRLWIAPGVGLVACKTQKSDGVFNNGFYTVIGVEGNTVRLQDDDVGGTIEIPLRSLQKLFRGRGAITYWCSQGRTLQGRVVCWGMKNPRITERLIEVGLSRATSIELVRVAP